MMYGRTRESCKLQRRFNKNFDTYTFTNIYRYLVLEYIEGGELFDYLIKKGRLEEREAVNYFRQIVQGVHYCHKFNICHRDLKPENLLLDKERNIKIADFGMAALEINDRMLETSCGSPHYASPEIVAGKNYHGGPSDIWSCGIILFALLTGHLPFDDENIRRLLLKVQSGKFKMPEYLSIEAKDLISRMLRINPQERLHMSEILKHPLLKKYPQRIPGLKQARRLPTTSGTTDATKPIKTIDEEILKNLQTLWHGEDRERIIEKLMSDELNSEKTFYCLLMKYRHDHRHDEEEQQQEQKKIAAPQPQPINQSHRRKSSQSVSGSGNVVYTVSRPKSALSQHNHKGSHSRNGSKSSVISQSSSHRGVRRKPSKEMMASNNNNHHPPQETPPSQQDSSLVVQKVRKNSNPVRTGSVSSGKPKYVEPEFNFEPDHTTSSRVVSNPIEQQPRNDQVQPPERRAFSLGVERRASMFDPGSRPYSTVSTESTESTNSSQHQDPQGGLLPKIFEEDRFADAIEEEVEEKIHPSKENRYKFIQNNNKEQQQQKTPNKKNYDISNEFDKIILQTNSTDELYKGLHLPENSPLRPSGVHQSPGANNGNNHDSSRLQISGLMKTDSFKLRSSSSYQQFHFEQSEQQNKNYVYKDAPPQQPPQQHEPQSPSRKPLVNKDINKERKTVQTKRPPGFVSNATEPIPPPTSNNITSRKPSETTNLTRGTSLFKKLVAKRPPPPPPAHSPWVDEKNNNSVAPPPAAGNEVKQNWFMKMLNSNNSSYSSASKNNKPEPIKKTIYSTLPILRLRQVIMDILTNWQQYGITKLSEDQSAIYATISSRNVLKVRSARFKIQIQTIRGVSAAVFIKEKGSTLSFERFLGEIEPTIEQITREHHTQYQRRQKKSMYESLRQQPVRTH